MSKAKTKKNIQKILQKIFIPAFSRLFYILVGIMLVAGGWWAWAAWDTSMTPGDMLTATRWNEVINKIKEIDLKKLEWGTRAPRDTTTCSGYTLNPVDLVMYSKKIAIRYYGTTGITDCTLPTCDATRDGDILSCNYIAAYERYYSDGWSSCQPITNTKSEKCEWTTTPYLFTQLNGRYYLNNEVMITYWDQYYERAKQMYENNEAQDRFRPTDYYVMRLNPQVNDQGRLPLLLREIEPEESWIDEFRLIRAVYPQTAQLITTNNQIKAINIIPLPERLQDCQFNQTTDCNNLVVKSDNQNLEGFADDELRFQFAIDDLDTSGNKVYLALNTWYSEALPIQPEPFKAEAHWSLKIFYQYNNQWQKIGSDVHPREIEDFQYLDLSSIIAKLQADQYNTLRLRIQFTEHHFVDYVGLIQVQELPLQQEELPLLVANHSQDGDVLPLLLKKDKQYAHTVRGDEIKLEFAAPKLPLKEGQKEGYVFISSGFYHGLRTFLYPKVDPSDSYIQEIKQYVQELEEFLGSKLKYNLED